MEEEQGDVGVGGSVAVSKSPLSGELPGEVLVVSMGGGNYIEEGYEVGDEGEIMVEIVGSDVFVNGVGGHKCDGDFEGHEWENREETGNQNFLEAMDVSNEGDGDKMRESEIGFLESRRARVSGDEVWNPGIQTTVVKEQTKEAMDRTRVVISEEKFVKFEAVDEDSANFVTYRISNRPVEAVVEGKVRSPEKKEMSSSSGNDAELGQLGEDSVTVHEVTNASDGAQLVPSELPLNSEGLDNVQVGGIDGAVGEVGLTNVTGGGEVLPTNCPKDEVVKAKPEMASTDSDYGIEAKIVDETDIFAAESKEFIVKMEAIVSDVQDENQGCLEEFQGIKFGPTHGCDDASHGSQPDGDGIAGVSKAKGVKIEIQADTEKNQPNMMTLSSPGDAGIVQVNSVINQASILPEITEKAELNVSTTNVSLPDGGDIKDAWGFDVSIPSDEVNKSREEEDTSSNGNVSYIVEGHTSETKLVDAEEARESDRNYDGGMLVDCGEPELGTEKHASEIDKFNLPNEETIKSASLLRMYQPGYLSTRKDEGHFAQSDLVWGKVLSHPLWPGQIFDQADASEKAIKYYRKDSYLVAHFGDRTFAWNDASVLKPFMPYFSQIEKQSNSESFQNAVNCALEEVSRRVELGLACSCIPKDAYIKIGTQVIDNAGIREESSRRCGVYHSSRATFFEPDKLLEYVIDLAPCASSCTDRLDLVIARAQLSAFYRFKGYRSPTEFLSSGELLGDTDTEQLGLEMVAFQKLTHTPMEGSHSRKERSLTELMGEREYFPDAGDESVAEDLGKSFSLSFGRKRKALDPLANGSHKRVSMHDAKLFTSMSHTPNPFSKIGESIRRVASQLTGSTSLVKGNNDEAVIDGYPKITERQSLVVSAESLSVNEMLLQLQLVAQDPKNRHNVQNTIYTFFLSFRSSSASDRRHRKKMDGSTICGSGEEFEFDDVKDSYRTGMIVQNYSGKQLRRDRMNGNGIGIVQLALSGAEKSVKTGHKSHSRKRFSSGNYPTAATVSIDNVKRRKQESSPAELIMNFAESKCLPSEISLNKMFRRFGPLMESETEVDHDSGRAKVIFKRSSDAEVAQDSAEKFNIFGPGLVNYQIGYSPLISVKILPHAIPPCP